MRATAGDVLQASISQEPFPYVDYLLTVSPNTVSALPQAQDPLQRRVSRRGVFKLQELNLRGPMCLPKGTKNFTRLSM